MYKAIDNLETSLEEAKRANNSLHQDLDMSRSERAKDVVLRDGKSSESSERLRQAAVEIEELQRNIADLQNKREVF